MKAHYVSTPSRARKICVSVWLLACLLSVYPVYNLSVFYWEFPISTIVVLACELANVRIGRVYPCVISIDRSLIFRQSAQSFAPKVQSVLPLTVSLEVPSSPPGWDRR